MTTHWPRYEPAGPMPLSPGCSEQASKYPTHTEALGILDRMIDPVIKRSLGQMIKGVEVVGAHHAGITRAYCSHWVTQVSFEEPIVMASALLSAG